MATSVAANQQFIRCAESHSGSNVLTGAGLGPAKALRRWQNMASEARQETGADKKSGLGASGLDSPRLRTKFCSHAVGSHVQQGR